MKPHTAKTWYLILSLALLVYTFGLQRMPAPVFEPTTVPAGAIATTNFTTVATDTNSLFFTSTLHPDVAKTNHWNSTKNGYTNAANDWVARYDSTAVAVTLSNSASPATFGYTYYNVNGNQFIGTWNDTNDVLTDIVSANVTTTTVYPTWPVFSGDGMGISNVIPDSPLISTKATPFTVQRGVEDDNGSFLHSGYAITNVVPILVANGMYAAGYRWILINNWQGAYRDNSSHTNVAMDDNYTNVFGTGAANLALCSGFIHSNGFLFGVQARPLGNGFVLGQDAQTLFQNQDATNLVGFIHIDNFLVDCSGLEGADTATTTRTRYLRWLIDNFLNFYLKASYTYGQPLRTDISMATINQAWGPWVSSSANSWTLGGDGSSGFSNFTNHVGWALQTLPWQTPGHVYNFNSMSLYSGDTNKVRGAMGIRALFGSPIRLRDTNFTASVIYALTNAAVLGIQADPSPVYVVSQTNCLVVFGKNLIDGRKVLGFWNPYDFPSNMFVNFKDVGVLGPATVQSAWWGTNVPPGGTSMTVNVASNLCEIFILTQPARTNVVSGQVYINSTGKPQWIAGTIINVLTNDYAAADLIVDPLGGTAFTESNSVLLFPNPYSTATQTNGIILSRTVSPGAAWAVTNRHNAALLPGWQITTFP